MTTLSSKVRQIQLKPSNLLKSQLPVHWDSHGRPIKINHHSIVVSFLKSILDELGAKTSALKFRCSVEFIQLIKLSAWTMSALEHLEAGDECLTKGNVGP